MKIKLKAKGQSALEYLMSYGWAILIIGIVGVVLWTQGVLSPPVSPPGCTGFSQLRVMDHSASQSRGNFTLTLINDAGAKIELTNVVVNITGSECDSGALTDELRSGETYLIGLTGDCMNEIESGGYYRGEVILTYRNIASAINHRSTGECHAYAED